MMETELLKARAEDTAAICARTGRPKYLGFLSAAEAVFAERLLKNSACRTELWGGYETAERVMLGCFPDWAEDSFFPVSSVTFTYRGIDSLSHRDFLGTLMSLGITRESVGDILTEQGRAVVFVTDEIKSYILTQVTKVGGTGVAVSEGFAGQLPQSGRLAGFSGTCASERIDCVVSELCGLSRSRSSELISQGLVTVNSVQVLKSTKTVEAGDIISVRGKGRFAVDSLDGRTKKNRIIIKYKIYV